MRLPLFIVALALPCSAADFKIGAHTFTLPDGFEIEAAATPPLVLRPITMAFDEAGALYVADSSGSNDKPEAQVKNPTHRVLRLVDKDGDGRFDDSTVFADKLAFPEGTMWLDGSLYVAAPPVIWKLTDTDADGIADKRDVWFDGKTLTGCANDLHGPYAGPDGFIYWCKGAFAEQRHTLADGTELRTKASHVFRARPDGSALENVMTGGMDNPVDVVFTPGGERLVSGTFFIHPGGGQRDGILHAVWGGVYGKDHAVLDGHPRTGELMPIMTHLGPGAPCGLELTRTPALGPPGDVFCCHFNLRKITRHALAPDGATFKTTDSDFVVSDNTDFHPTDIIEDADGSLLIADTGGWYKMCCPTSQLAKADVLGAIYRVRKKGAPRADDPRGLRLDWQKPTPAELAARLADPRPAVADRTMAALAKLGEAAIPHVSTLISTPRTGANTTPTAARLNAIWTFTRIPGDAARAAVRFAFADKDPLVRIAAAHSASLWRDTGASEALINHLTHADAQLRRIAAEALGRIGDKRAAPHLLAAAPQNADRFLEHTLATALVELGDAEIVRARLNQPNAAAARVGLIAADNLRALTAKAMIAALSSNDADTRRIAEWLAARHPEWGNEVAAWLRTQLCALDTGGRTMPEQLARFARSTPVQELIAQAAAGKLRPELPPGNVVADERVNTVAVRGHGFRAMKLAAGVLRDLPGSWVPVLASAISNDDDSAHALELARVFAARKELPPALCDALRDRASDTKLSEQRRAELLSLLPARSVELETRLFLSLTSQFSMARLSRELGEKVDRELRAKFGDGNKDFAPRRFRGEEAIGVVAELFSRAKLTDEQLTTLTGVIGDATPRDAARLLAAYESNSAPTVGERLVVALRNSKLASKVNPDAIRRAFAKQSEKLRDEAEQLIAAVTPDATQQRARLDALAAELPKGDVRRGHQIFRGTKSACTTCHAMAYVGGNLGPDLTKIGATRTERDLLEALVFPSASFVRSYEPVVVKTKAGDTPGILKKDAADEVVLATGVGTESRIPRADVLDIQPGATSLMPQGYDGILTPQELADLVAFLKQAK